GQALASGGSSGQAEVVAAVRKGLLPRAAVFTPNLAEAEAFTGRVVNHRDSMVAAARTLLEMGPSAVMITGGHLIDADPADAANSPDLVLVEGSEPVWLESPRLGIRHTHGTGCVLSAAICAGLGLGLPVLEACRQGKNFVTRAIAAGVDLGAGDGPVDPHFVDPASERL
ncbi:MAG: bifunctional hydroxymethylpyrimidine kinase/phosphomethylpyrimidine kinase, partial [Pseudonocardiaceae bacterium]